MMSATKSADPRIQYISDSIRAIPDFPHEGKFLSTTAISLRVTPIAQLGIPSVVCSCLVGELTWCRDYVPRCDDVAVGSQGVQRHNRHLRRALPGPEGRRHRGYERSDPSSISIPVDV